MWLGALDLQPIKAPCACVSPHTGTRRLGLADNGREPGDHVEQKQIQINNLLETCGGNEHHTACLDMQGRVETVQVLMTGFTVRELWTAKPSPGSSASGPQRLDHLLHLTAQRRRATMKRNDTRAGRVNRHATLKCPYGMNISHTVMNENDLLQFVKLLVLPLAATTTKKLRS